MNNFQKLISNKRKELKLTQKDLAEKLNVSDKTVSKWETGKSYPDITLITTLAKVLELELAELLESDDLEEDNTNLNKEKNYNREVIETYKKNIFKVIGIIVAGIILFFATFIIEDGNIQILTLAGSLISTFWGILFFIKSNINYRSYYIRKSYTQDYDHVYAKYANISLIIFSLPFMLMSLYVPSSVNLMTVTGIMKLTSLIGILLSIILILKILHSSNYKVKKDITNKTLVIISILLFLSMITNLLPLYFLPPFYTLLFVIINRKEYINK